MTRPLFTATFWLDAAERCIKTVAQVALGTVGTNVVDLTSLDLKQLAGVVGFSAALSILSSIISSGIGEPGSASLLNPAPPDTLNQPPEGN